MKSQPKCPRFKGFALVITLTLMILLTVIAVDRPSLNVYTDTTAAKASKTFGRRINLVSFRWLSSNEI